MRYEGSLVGDDWAAAAPPKNVDQSKSCPALAAASVETMYQLHGERALVAVSGHFEPRNLHP